MTLRRQLRALGTALRPQRGLVVLLGLIVASGAGAALAGPLLLSRYIDAYAGGFRNRVLLAAVLFLITACAQPLLTVAEAWVATLVAWRATNRLREQLFRHCLQGDPDLVQLHPPGTLITRIDGDAEILSDFLSTFVARLATSVLIVLGVVVILALIDWRLGAILTVAALLSAALLYGPRPLQLRLWGRNRTATASELGLAEETLQAADDLRANGGAAWASDVYERRSETTYRTFRSAVLLENGGFGLSVAVYGCATALAMLAAVLLPGVAVGTVYLVYAFASAVSTPLQQLARQIQLLQSAGAALSRIEELLAVSPRVTWTAAAVALPHRAPAVELEGVEFAYPGDGPSLHQLSLHLAAGRRLGVVGRSGSGKTTLARLLLRFWDPDRGTVRLDGIDLRAVRQADLRRLVGFVPQDVQLLHATLRENLSLFDPAVPDRRLREALGEVGLDPWLRGLPAGLDTMLAPGGQDLSAGQSQLLAAARAFLADPRLLILDEASSRVDPATEERLQQAFARLFAGRTTVVIAHRPATLREVDDLLVLDRGRQLEFGDRRALLGTGEDRFLALLGGEA